VERQLARRTYLHTEVHAAIRADQLRPLQDDVEDEEKLVMVLRNSQYDDRRNNRYRLGPSLSRCNASKR
jgi:hypothetical protein